MNYLIVTRNTYKSANKSHKRGQNHRHNEECIHITPTPESICLQIISHWHNELTTQNNKKETQTF